MVPPDTCNQNVHNQWGWNSSVHSMMGLLQQRRGSPSYLQPECTQSMGLEQFSEWCGGLAAAEALPLIPATRANTINGVGTVQLVMWWACCSRGAPPDIYLEPQRT